MNKLQHVARSLVAMGSLVAFGACVDADDSATNQSASQTSRVWINYKAGQKADARAAIAAANAVVHHDFDALGAVAASVPSAALNGLRNNPHITAIEEDPARYPSGSTLPAGEPYGLPLVQAPSLQAAGFKGAGRKVCVIDSGLKVWGNLPAPGGAITYISGNLPPDQDGSGHGTHVANTVAGQDTGVAPGTHLLIVRVFDDSGSWAYSSSLVAAAHACRDAGANIISMSLGGSFKSRNEQVAFDTLYNSNGILNIAAAGNDGNSRTSYPAGYGSVVSVAAIDRNKQVASFSQFNKDVEIAAPGVAVYSQTPWRASDSATVNGVTYQGGHFEGAATNVTGSGAVANGGLCDSVGAWSGKVVHCLRGSITFADKVKNAQTGGATAVIISNNVDGPLSGTLGDFASSIPVVGLTKAEGEAVTAAAGTPGSVTSTYEADKNGYEAWDGTSMATPHVSGVAAAVWGACPGKTASQIRNALNSTAQDLGAAGRDVYYGYGLVLGCSAARALCNASCTP